MSTCAGSEDMGQNPPIRPIISLRGITKKTSDTFSNDGIDLDVYKGEIHVLIGESGSGKTTLTDIMCGKLRPDFGAMFIMGKKVEAYSLDVVSKMGIALIPRNPVIIPSFTIMENIILGVSSAKKVFISEMEMLERTEKISSSFGLKVNPAALANKATQGLKMRIEIVKAIYKGARILIFDEPDTVLSPQEAVEMFLMFKTLAIRGRTIIITTDKFNDIIGVADRISVLSKGKVIRTFLSRQADERELAKLMFGANSVIKAGEETSNPKNVILDVFNVQFSEDREISKSGQGITFRVGGGEVLGLLEIDGGGRENLIKVITGYKRAMKGTVKINGVDVTNKTPHQVIRHKVAYFSRDEKKVRAISDFTVTENIVMGIRNKNPFSRGGFIRRKEVARLVSALMGSFKLASADKKVQVKFLSEVERQKVVLASELYTRPEIL